MAACRPTMSRLDSQTYKPTNIIVLNRLVPQPSSGISHLSARLPLTALNTLSCPSPEVMEVKFTMDLVGATWSQLLNNSEHMNPSLSFCQLSPAMRGQAAT